MLTQLGYDDIKNMLHGAIEIIRQTKDELSLLDAAIGDGDHGITMLRAFEKVGSVINTQTKGEISSMLEEIAWALMDIDGGCAGPLYGSLFMGMAEATANKPTLNTNSFVGMFESGLVSVQEQTKARIGDKTMMDALIPAVQEMRLASNQDKSITEILEIASLAARRGAEFTKNFPARFGRAKHQGERTIGHPDPGSISMAYVFQGFRNGIDAE